MLSLSRAQQPTKYLTLYRWRAAMVLACLAAADEALTLVTLGATLALDHTGLHAALMALEDVGLAERAPLPRRLHRRHGAFVWGLSTAARFTLGLAPLPTVGIRPKAARL